MPDSADVVIVGAGLSGLSVAAALAPERRVVLVEQGEAPGAEASADNAGMVRRLGEDPFERALAVRTAELLERDWPEASRRTGAVIGLSFDADHLADGVAHLRARGVRVEALDRPEAVAPVLAGSRLVRAWYLPDERVADPAALVAGLWRVARRHGAALRLGERVEALLVEGGRVRGVRTDRGLLAAGEVVLAAGAWTARLVRPLGLRRPLTPLRRHLLLTEPHPLSRPDHPWTWVDDVGVYVRPEAGGWLGSGCDERVDPPPPGPGGRGPVEEFGRALFLDKLRAVMPAVADARPSRGWTSLRTFAPDRRPLLGPDGEVEGLHWAAGLGGFGVTCSLAVGEAVAAWMAGAELPWVRRDGLRPDRPHLGRWPIRPTGSIGRTRLVPAEPPAG